MKTSHSPFPIPHSTKGGFTSTPILVLFRFLKILSLVAVTSVQELISAKNFSETKKPHQNWCRGFTMVELLVTLGIFTVMTGVVLAKYRTFDTNAKFSNAAEDVVLALRQAQVYGAGVKGMGTSFDVPYGVHFVPNANNIILFADKDSDGKYTATDAPPIDTIKWDGGIKISSVSCAWTPCNSFLDITFKRPDISAIVGDNGGSGYSIGAISVTNGVAGAGAKFATTTINSSGQIWLQ